MKPTIPRGWRRVRTGARVRKGDKYNDVMADRWEEINRNAMLKIPKVLKEETIIRRVAKGRK